MVLVAVPAAEAVRPALVTMQLGFVVPEAPAVKVMLVPVVEEVMVPPVIVQAYVLPAAWLGTLAV